MKEEKKAFDAQAETGELTKELTEEHLEDAAGGAPGIRDTSCWFTPTGNTKVEGAGFAVKTYWAECASSCRSLLISKCSCYADDHCVSKWHRITADGILYKPDWWNHQNKRPENNYNT